MSLTPWTEALSVWFGMCFGAAVVVDLVYPVLDMLRSRRREWK
jgi:hypothetical protein